MPFPQTAPAPVVEPVPAVEPAPVEDAVPIPAVASFDVAVVPLVLPNDVPAPDEPDDDETPVSVPVVPVPVSAPLPTVRRPVVRPPVAPLEQLAEILNNTTTRTRENTMKRDGNTVGKCMGMTGF